MFICNNSGARIAFFLLPFFITIISCSTRTVELEEAQGPIALLPDSSLERFSSPRAIPRGPDGIMTIYDEKRKAVLFFDPHGKELSRVNLQLPDSFRRSGQLPFIQPFSPDSIFVIPGDARSIFLFNRKGEIQRVLDASTTLKDGTTDFVLVGMGKSAMISDGQQLFVTCARMDVELRTPENRRTYFSTPPDIAIDLQTGKAINSGVWPGDYTTGDAFRDYYPQRCSNDKGEIIYGFAASDSIFCLKNGNIIDRYCIVSKFMSERHAYPDDSLDHLHFLDRYFVTEPRYLSLQYDPYRKLYYRVVHEAIAYEKADGLTKNRFHDKPWALMILDENFNKLNEIPFDPQKFVPLVFPVKEGLLVLHRQKENDVPPVIFSLFKFKA